MRNSWTIAYRNPRANRFVRDASWEGTWAQAYDLACRLAEAHPELQIFYVPTLASEIEHAEYRPDLYGDDVANILVDSGRRVRVIEGGPIDPPSATENASMAPAPKRLVIGRRMRAAVAYVAKHEGCTKYAAGKAVTRLGRQRDGWVIVQRAIDAGLISARKRRDGTTALSVTEAGWVS